MNNESEKGERRINYQFKILYAIGMVLVVANHCLDGGVSLFYELFPAYAFHMGLFVFCSGYFYKENAEQNISQYFLKKIKSLIIPLYIWNFIYALFAQIMSKRGFSMGVGVSWYKLIISPITSGHQFVYNLASWFVIPLFMVEVFNIFFRKALFFIKNDSIKELTYILVSFAIGMCGIFMSSRGLNTGWWLVLARMMHFIPYYSVGFFYNKVLEKKDTISNGWYFFVVVFLDLIVIIYNGGALYYEQAWCRFSEFNVWPFVVGFLGIAFWLRVARMLEPVIGRSKIVNLIADNTFSIMVNQFLGFMLVKSFFSFLFKNTDRLFQDFDWNAYHNSIWYYYLPKGLQQTRIIYVFAAITVGVLIQILVNKGTALVNKIITYKNWNRRTVYIISGAVIIAVSGISAFTIANDVKQSGGVMLESVNEYELDKVLYFDRENFNAGKYIISGFSHAEESCTWTDGNEVILSFTINNIQNDLQIEYQCGIYGECQNVDIYVNNRLITKEIFTGNNVHYVSVPMDLVKEGEIQLKYKLPNVISPAEAGKSDDIRKLGLSMQYIIIREEKNKL